MMAIALANAKLATTPAIAVLALDPLPSTPVLPAAVALTVAKRFDASQSGSRRDNGASMRVSSVPRPAASSDDKPMPAISHSAIAA